MEFRPRHFRPLIQSLGLAAQRMEPTEAERWHGRLRLIYGQMDGQRAVDVSSLAEDLDRPTTVFALEAAYFLLCNLLARAAFEPCPHDDLRRFSESHDREFDSRLEQTLDGSALEQVGVGACRHSHSFAWLQEPNERLRSTLREFVATAANLWEGDRLRVPGDDPLQTLHRTWFPVNLTHISGQVLTPEWLAETMVADSDWSPDQSMIDPYCGSGVMLVKALVAARMRGVDPVAVIPKLCGIDLDPFAAAAARANLALQVARSRREGGSNDAVRFDVFNADSIGPVIRRESSHGESPGLQQGKANDERWIRDQAKMSSLPPADVLLTNPPWVGWEYLSRPYRQTLHGAWLHYDLFQAKGMEASFLKEDLSNLALLAGWDLYLREGGTSVVLLRPSTMQSETASRGVRRLSLREHSQPMRLEHIRTFPGFRAFPQAQTGAVAWKLRKGDPTCFPVPVTAWIKQRSGWNPAPSDSLASVMDHVAVRRQIAEPSDGDDAGSRWMVADEQDIESFRLMRGSNDYQPRMGVFTGGANAVFYFKPIGGENRYRNLLNRSRRRVPEVEVELESELVHEVARGRDLMMWHYVPSARLLLPHTSETGMRPLEEDELSSQYPNAFEYLHRMRSTLEQRHGFAGWEKRIQRQYFYSLQRVGPYTFAPWKVGWRYISNEFTICVLGRDERGRAIIPNDKVMFVPCQQAQQAYFLAGYLSSSAVRKYVASSSDRRQISTRVIRSLAIPNFDRSNEMHHRISQACEEGHRRKQADPNANIDDLLTEIDKAIT